MSKLRKVLLVGLIIFVCLVFAAIAQVAPTTGGAGRGAGMSGTMSRGGLGTTAADPRVQNKTYVLTDTNEPMPYSLFVSSKVSKDKKAPLVVVLHGLGVDNTFMLRGNLLDLAEEGGYIAVAPLGYTTGGWFGITSMAQMMSGMGRGMTRGAPATALDPQDSNNAAPAQRGAPAGRGAMPGTRGSSTGMRGFSFGGSAGGTAVTDPVKVAELSEKDVMNVFAIIRKEYNIDERRTYLMGHSMGGAGTLNLGVKYASNWAAIGAMAPAAFTMQPDSLEKIKDMPVIIVQGDADTLVPVTNTRLWADKAKELKMTYEYKELPGVDHGSVITSGTSEIFKFFAAHTKPETK
jgi:predicted esterase